MSHDSMVSLQHFFIRQSHNETKKRQKLFTQCQHLKKEMTLDSDKKKKKDGIVLFCFNEDELDVVLCVKASEFMHTRKHTQCLIHRMDSQSVPGK